MEKYIEIKNEKIPIILRNYKNAKSVKMYFRGYTLNISKPARMGKKELLSIVKKYEEQLYTRYKEILSSDSEEIKHWKENEKILYKGEEYTIRIKENKEKEINIKINEKEKEFNIEIPEEIIEDEKGTKKYIDKGIKTIFQKNTREIIQSKLLYWSKITDIQYKNFKIRDAISKYGSCKPKTKELMFNSRLIMLPEDKIDAIIVHELCHITFPNHSKEFYELIKKYIPNYDEINKWLKINASKITI